MSHFEVLVIKNRKKDIEEILKHLGCEIKRHYQFNTPNQIGKELIPSPSLKDPFQDNMSQLIQMLDKVLSFQDQTIPLLEAGRTKPPNLYPGLSNSTRENIQALNSRMKDCLFLKKNCRYVKVPVKDICWIEASRSSLIVCLENGKRFALTTNLKAFQSQYTHQDLIRTHRSYIINIQKVEAIKGRQFIIKDKEIPFSESYISDINDLFPMIRSKV